MAQATGARKPQPTKPKPAPAKRARRPARDPNIIYPEEHQTTVSSKYQVVIPKRAREEAGIKPGQKLSVLVKDGSVTLVPIPTIDELRGFAPGINLDDIRDHEDRY
jgi:AbrB family looped-hinge helix DNA binding protein